MKMKKMNKKGFTLIELLAIIVILAIIAVITVPLILNIIDDAKKGAERNSVIGYGKAVELAYTQGLWDKELNDGNANTVGTPEKLYVDSASGATSGAIDINVVYEGSAVDCERLELNAGKLTMTGCKVTNGSDTIWKYESGKVTEQN